MNRPCLPDTCVVTVMSHMDVPSLLRASAVCKQWNHFVFSTPRLWSHLVQKGPAEGYLGLITKVPEFLRSLELRKWNTELAIRLPSMPNLTTLRMNLGRGATEMAHHREEVSCDFCNLITQLRDTAPNLERLAIVNKHCCLSAINAIAANWPELTELRITCSYPCSDVAMQVLTSRLHRLEVLKADIDLSRKDALRSLILSPQAASRIRRLRLRFTRANTLSANADIDFRELENLANFACLQTLSIVAFDLPLQVSNLAQLSNLKELKICNASDDETEWISLWSSAAFRLSGLLVSGCNGFTDRVIDALIDRQRSMETFCLASFSGDEAAISANSLSHLAGDLVNVQHLSIEGSYAENTVAQLWEHLSANALNLTSLKYLYIATEASDTLGLRHCMRLKELLLNQCIVVGSQKEITKNDASKLDKMPGFYFDSWLRENVNKLYDITQIWS